jgi:predicted hydrolase (HD superfamily)
MSRKRVVDKQSVLIRFQLLFGPEHAVRTTEMSVLPSRFLQKMKNLAAGCDLNNKDSVSQVETTVISSERLRPDDRFFYNSIQFYPI